jgi:uncharacterized protein (TIGR00255 family)
MTGYGRGEASDGILKINVEIQSVNRRQADVVISLPRGFDALESPLRKVVSSVVSRGRVSVRFHLEDLSGKVVSQNFNHEVAGKYLDQLRDFASRFNISHEVTLGEIARLPGVFDSASGGLEAEQFLPVFEDALKAGLDLFIKSREEEGMHLREYLVASVRQMKEMAGQIAESAPAVMEYHRRQLAERLRRAGVETDVVDPNRLAQEVVMIADRCDVTEELDRLDSHFRKFDDCINGRGSLGRTLDFLAQEMFREINTAGSKANDAGLSHLVVQFKTELEKFREQVQNVE